MRIATVGLLLGSLHLLTPHPATAAEACDEAAAQATAGAHDEAIAAWRRCLQAGGASPSPAHIHMAIARAELATDRIAYAIESLKRAVELDPTLAEAYLERARAHRRAGMKDESLRDAALALRHADDDALKARALTHRGDDYARLNLYMQAMGDLDQALRLHPHAPAYLSRARLNREIGRGEAALADLDRAIESRPDLVAAYAERAELRAILGQHAGAVRDAEQAVRLTPRSAEAHAFRCRLLNSLALSGIGLESCLTATRLDRQADRYQLEHAFARWQQEDADGMRTALGIAPGGTFDAAGSELIATFPRLLGERLLASLGYGLEEVDGVVDVATREALARFEGEHGTPADPALGEDTLRHLREVLHARIRTANGSLDLRPPEPVLEVMSGPAAGRTITLWDLPMTLGRQGGQRARIERQADRFTVTHVEGPPVTLNGTPLTPAAAIVGDDVLGIFGVEIAFRLP